MEFQAYNCFLSRPVTLLHLAMVPLIQTKPALFFRATHLLIRDSWGRTRHLHDRPPLCTLAALTSLCFLQQALIALPKGCCSLSVHALLKWLSIQWKATEVRDASPILTFSSLACLSLRTSNLKLHSTIFAFYPFATALSFLTQTLFSNILMHLLSPCDFIYCITKSSKCTLNGSFPSFLASLAQTIPWGSCDTEAPSSARRLLLSFSSNSPLCAYPGLDLPAPLHITLKWRALGHEGLQKPQARWMVSESMWLQSRRKSISKCMEETRPSVEDVLRRPC